MNSFSSDGGKASSERYSGAKQLGVLLGVNEVSTRMEESAYTSGRWSVNPGHMRGGQNPLLSCT